jgi:hypothetical protein
MQRVIVTSVEISGEEARCLKRKKKKKTEVTSLLRADNASLGIGSISECRKKMRGKFSARDT